MMRTVMVVDDEEHLRRMVKEYLIQEGFRVVTAADGQEALFVARYEKPDLIILDLMMPRMNGYEFIRSYAKEGSAPIIVLTAKVDETDKVLGLELGADDYVTKPFSLRELSARVRAVLRRSEREPAAPELLRAGDIVANLTERTVMVRGESVQLTPSEFALLTTLMAKPGRPFTRAELLDRIQGAFYEGYERTIDVHIRNLRSKIEPNPGEPLYIQTVYGVGYRFNPDIVHGSSQI